MKSILFLAAMSLTLLSGCAGLPDRVINRVIEGEIHLPDMTATQRDEFEQFYTSLFIADLHADPLLWNRSHGWIEEGRGIGHLDLPRMRQAGMNLQVFGLVTKSGLPLNTAQPPPGEASDKKRKCHGKHDFVGTLWTMANRPAELRDDLMGRALYQIHALNGLESAYRTWKPHLHGKAVSEVIVLRTAQDMARLRTAWERGEKPIGALAAMEGLHPIEASPRQGVAELHRAGVRMMSFTHHFDNGLALASEGCESDGQRPSGLTATGKEALREMLLQNVIIDLAHAAPETIRDVLSEIESIQPRPPLLVSHTILQRKPPEANNSADSGKNSDAEEATYRNLSAQQARDIVRAGGVIGIMFWPKQYYYYGNDRHEAFLALVQAFNHLHQVLSAPDFVKAMNEQRGCTSCYNPAEHMAFGSDFDGGIHSPIDVTGLRDLVLALRRTTRDGSQERRYSDDDLRKIAGVNACRIIATALSAGQPGTAASLCPKL